MGSPIDWTHFQTWKQYAENPNGTGYRKNVYICREGNDWYDGAILKQDGLVIDRTCTATNYLEMGNVAAAALTLTIVAPPQDIDSWAVDQTLEIQVDIFERSVPSVPEDGGSGTAYMGFFIIDSITERNGAYVIEALDRMVLLDVPMDWSGLVPPDIPSILNKISTVYGITVATDITTLPNYFQMFLDYPNLTVRQVISTIAEVMGCCAFMDWNGELRFSWYAPILNASASTLELTREIAFSRRTDPQSYDLDDYGIGDPDGTKVEVTGPDECKYYLVGNALVESMRSAGLVVSGVSDNIRAARYTDVQFQGEYHYYSSGEYEVLPFPYIWPMDVIDVDGVFIPINHVVYRLNANMSLTASADPRVSDYSTAFTSTQQTVLDRMESETEAINKHFFYTNATGAHVTTTENDPDTGNNVLIDSSGLYVREDTDVLAAFTADGANFTSYNDQELALVNSVSHGTQLIANGINSSVKALALVANDKDVVTHGNECGTLIELRPGIIGLCSLSRDNSGHALYGNYDVWGYLISVNGSNASGWKTTIGTDLLDVDGDAKFMSDLTVLGGVACSEIKTDSYIRFTSSNNPNYQGAYIVAADGDANGSVMLIRPGASLIAGGGEYASNRWGVGDISVSNKNTFIGADSIVYIESNGGTIANRKTWAFGINGHIVSPGGGVIAESATAPITLSSTGDIGISAASESAAGSMSAADKTKLNKIAISAAKFSAGAVSQDAGALSMYSGWDDNAIGDYVGLYAIKSDELEQTRVYFGENRIRLRSYDRTSTDASYTNTLVWDIFPTSGTAPITVTNGAISHDTSGVTAGTKGTNNTTALTPAFGDTFNVIGLAVNDTGHITSANSHTVKMPNTAASSDAAGLMPAADKTFVDARKMYYQTNNSSAISLSAGTITKVTLTATNRIYNGTNWAISSGGVKVTNAGRYRISGSVSINSASGQTTRSAYVYKGTSATITSNTQICEAQYAGAASGPIAISPKIVELAANDIVFLGARSQGAASSCPASQAGTYLLIERLS